MKSNGSEILAGHRDEITGEERDVGKTQYIASLVRRCNPGAREVYAYEACVRPIVRQRDQIRPVVASELQHPVPVERWPRPAVEQ